MLTAGFRCAPEILPMNKMMPMTIRPGATTAAVRLMTPGNAWPIMPPPAATTTSRNVPYNSREQAPPFLARIIKILNPLHDALLYCSQHVGDDAVMGVALVSAVFVLICRHGCPPPQVLAMWSAVPSLGLPPQKANVPLPATVVSAPRVARCQLVAGLGTVWQFRKDIRGTKS